MRIRHTEVKKGICFQAESHTKIMQLCPTSVNMSTSFEDLQDSESLVSENVKQLCTTLSWQNLSAIYQ